MLSQADQYFLLKLARRTIETFLTTGQYLMIDPSVLPSAAVAVKRGSFVTLHSRPDKSLRGCIGKISGEKLLYEDIIDNAVAAAFRDFRFQPITSQELPKINIEISILTNPQKVIYQDLQALLDKITPDQDGLIFQKDGYNATFLPQVWEQLPNKRDFLSHLSLKAGLAANAWQDQEAEFFTYQVEKFSENL